MALLLMQNIIYLPDMVCSGSAEQLLMFLIFVKIYDYLGNGLLLGCIGSKRIMSLIFLG